MERQEHHSLITRWLAGCGTGPHDAHRASKIAGMDDVHIACLAEHQPAGHWMFTVAWCAGVPGMNAMASDGLPESHVAQGALVARRCEVFFRRGRPCKKPAASTCQELMMRFKSRAGNPASLGIAVPLL